MLLGSQICLLWSTPDPHCISIHSKEMMIELATSGRARLFALSYSLRRIHLCNVNTLWSGAEENVALTGVKISLPTSNSSAVTVRFNLYNYMLIYYH